MKRARHKSMHTRRSDLSFSLTSTNIVIVADDENIDKNRYFYTFKQTNKQTNKDSPTDTFQLLLVVERLEKRLYPLQPGQLTKRSK